MPVHEAIERRSKGSPPSHRRASGSTGSLSRLILASQARVIAGFLLLFMAVGRPDNYYWGMIFAPLLTMGLPFAPAALDDLVRSAVGLQPAGGAARLGSPK